MSKYPVPPGSQIPGLEAIYEKYFTCDTGTFVEIGAFDGRTRSNTAGLADAGWTGIYVEANPDFAATCESKHAQNPRVQVHTTAIADFEGEADFWLNGECSTLVFDLSALEWCGGHDNKIKVHVSTLDNFLENRVVPGFELLVINVEQAEPRVLSGFTLSHWRPQMVIIEAHENDPAAHRRHRTIFINNYFARAGYTKVYAEHINSIFVEYPEGKA